MGASDPLKSKHFTRRDGWTPQRQLLFLKALERSRSVTRSARAVGMSRESAHRLRNRDPLGLFALMWDWALGASHWRPSPAEIDQSHIAAIRRACGSEGANFRLATPHGQLRDLKGPEWCRSPRAESPDNRAYNATPGSRDG